MPWALLSVPLRRRLLVPLEGLSGHGSQVHSLAALRRALTSSRLSEASRRELLVLLVAFMFGCADYSSDAVAAVSSIALLPLRWRLDSNVRGRDVE